MNRLVAISGWVVIMKYLLDTHVFLWMVAEPSKLSANAERCILDPANSLYISIVTLWEMQIKYQLGKLNLDVSITELWKNQKDENELLLLNTSEDHIWELSRLCSYHRDPFDRLLIAQARCEDMALITADGLIAKYDVEVVW